MQKHQLEKSIWTERDFAKMGWHDCKIWSFFAKEKKYKYFIDLDYIFQWEEGKEKFKFWVSPVTMVFENAFDISININSDCGMIEIADLHMKNRREAENGETFYDFIFECQEGEIKLTATNYKMYVRASPILTPYQQLEFVERGGINFDEISIEE